jgi:F-type H+-transporting ATPase subunit b
MRIDWWTLALQTVNVLILIWILARFFFRPIMNIVTKRQEEANKLLAAAAHARQDADEARADAGKARAKIADEQERLIAEARNTAKIEKQYLLAQTSDEIAKLRSETAATIARERAAAEEAIINRASELAVAIAQRLLARFADQNVFHTFVNEICREVRALSPEIRESLASAAATAHPIEIVTAAPLSDEETQHVGTALKEALGIELPFMFQVDPAVIGGIELKCHNTIIRNSWRADLDRIRRELSRGTNVS